ncbi:uncharacterized protein [Halyomorpha halys]|uniref:uncharacterized protein n=1 Tax=Halyomorpha halys TaxID=286706 RepID=UPI0006D4E25B|nr:uncharacterized protein LOC106685465 [Halyomorpha halys]
MADLLKQNIENLGGASVKRRKGNVPFEGIKKLKTFIKPLSDVKNIIEDKFNPEQLKKEVPVKGLLEPVLLEDNCNEDLFFFSQHEDHYDDIIPKFLQLEEGDISKVATLFDYSSTKNCQKEVVDYLPELDFEKTFYDCVNEDLCDVIKGIDSTSLLFDDLNYF